MSYMTYLSPTAKSQLSKTIRNLRDRLITDLHNAVESKYLMGVKLEQVQLDEERYCKRERLEKYLEELVKGDLAVYKGKQSPKLKQELRDRHRQDLEKLAAATWLNRLAVIKHLEAMELLKPKLVTGGWQSAAFKEFRDYAPEFLQEEDQGYGLLLRLVFDELAIDLSGLFGRGGLNGYVELIPMPALTLRYLVEELDKVEADAWRDDTTLGWIYQYWNDPEREGIDQKMNDGGKVEPHEIASKTQMFTERYMVEWLLQNSLNNQWLDICGLNGWVAEAVSDRTLENLESRRQDWRQRREAGDVALDELMAIANEQEQRWKYWVKPPTNQPPSPQFWGNKNNQSPQELGDLGGNLSLRHIKLIDPACGSGHFLVIAFDLLFAFYQEESRHRGEEWTDAAIANSILENNLYGIDIDARAVQMAAAALWLKAKGLCKDAAPRQINLVAANLNLANLPKDDPELLNFYDEVRLETGIPPKLTMQIVEALKGADVWGSLLKVGGAVTQAIADYEAQVKVLLEPQQGSLFEAYRPAQVRLDFDKAQAQVTVLEALERFLQQRSQSDDLGVRLWGEQLAAGVRFVRMVREGQYDLVIGNPPYQGTSKMADAGYLSKHYPKGKADLYAAFLQRGLELAKDGGFSAMITMRNWMFISQSSELREWLIDHNDLRLIGDVSWGAFSGMKDNPVTMSIFRNSQPSNQSISLSPTDPQERVRTAEEIRKKIAGLLSQVGRYEFKTQNFNVIKEKPLIYWWDDSFLKRYAETPKVGEKVEMWQGVATTNNSRFLRSCWEIKQSESWFVSTNGEIRLSPPVSLKWFPYVKGAKGRAWFDSVEDVINWSRYGLELGVCQDFYRIKHPALQLKDSSIFFRIAVAYSTIGASFSSRVHRFRSVFDVSGSSVFPSSKTEEQNLCCLMNSEDAKNVLSSLNPTVNFQVSDIKRLPLFPIESADEIFRELEKAFSEHEAGRETSVEFISPRPSPWRTAQTWAQTAVDRPAGAPLPPYIPAYDPPTPQDHISYAVGLALERFGRPSPPAPLPLRERGANSLTPPSPVLGEGGRGDEGNLNILYLSAYSHDLPEIGDRLTHPAATPIRDAWTEHGSKITKKTLREWLRQDYFKEDHLKRYDQRPIYFPISSTKKNFVAIIPIHQWTDNTLQTLLADHLLPDQNHLLGEINDLKAARSQGDSKAIGTAEKRYSELCKLQEELQDLINKVQAIAERGAPPTKSSDPPREVDATFKMDLDDGVMINSAALWTLLEPQWTKPKTWWSELSTAQNKKDYDWSHLAARYFPQRVDEKCQKDPSLAVAHSVFWKYHPAKAYEWELRLQDEIAPDFHIAEPDSQSLRGEFIKGNPELVLDLRQKEQKRRERKKNKEEDQMVFELEEETVP